MPVTLLHGTIEGGNFCSYCGRHRAAWASDDEPCDGEIPTTEEGVARAEAAMARDADEAKFLADVQKQLVFDGLPRMAERFRQIVDRGAVAAGGAAGATTAAAAEKHGSSL